MVALAGWINQQQREVIDYLQTENRVLREQLGASRLHFTDDQRIRLAAKAKHLRRRVLQEIGTIVTPSSAGRVIALEVACSPSIAPRSLCGRNSRFWSGSILLTRQAPH
jgi:hypothetical protein